LEIIAMKISLSLSVVVGLLFVFGVSFSFSRLFDQEWANVQNVDLIVGGETPPPINKDKNDKCCTLRCYRTPCSFEASPCRSEADAAVACVKSNPEDPPEFPIQPAGCAEWSSPEDEEKEKECKLKAKSVRKVFCDILGVAPAGVECPEGWVRCRITTAGSIDYDDPENFQDNVYVEDKDARTGDAANPKRGKDLCRGTNDRDPLGDPRPEDWKYECD
jgi:hypothetical protein